MGCPRLVLSKMVGSLTEAMACEIDPDAAHVLLKNAPPLQLHRDMHEQAYGKSFDFVAGKVTHICQQAKSSDCYVCGYPCNSNSRLNRERWTVDATTTSHAQVLESCIGVIELTRPRAFILENVKAILLKRAGTGPDAGKAVIDWVDDLIRARLSEWYVWFSVEVTSKPLPLGRTGFE